MYKGKKILGIITARGGSKGIPRKNIKELCGKPLIAYTTEAAEASKYLTRYIVSTDDSEIAEISRRYGADVPFMRPPELAQDKSTSLEVIQHALRKLKDDFGEEYDYAMILQPTSPLRTSTDIDACVVLAVDNDADSVMSMVVVQDFHPQKIKKIKEGRILPYFPDDSEKNYSLRRQDQELAYRRNCAVYLTKTSCLLAGDMFGVTSFAYVMPEERSLDINELVDFELSEFWMKRSR
ncbi:MAG: acylneuraminate cytidylyltransferase family protein [Patescibacteria group bacterium]